MNWDRWVGNFSGKPVFHIKHLVHLFGCRIDLHKMVLPDMEDCFHTHPAWAIRIILWGGYVEEIDHRDDLPNSFNSYKRWTPGRMGLVRPEFCHRVNRLITGVSYSLWFRGPRNYEIELVGEGWKKIEPQRGSQGTIL